VQNQNSTLNIKTAAFFQLSEDGISWDNPISLFGANYLIGNGTLTEAWYNATSNYKRFIRFGVSALQNSGTAVEMANVSLVLDVQLK
jgi:hypothetical protein